MGRHAADWLDGKSIPQAMDILPSALTAQNIARYETDLADPGAVYADTNAAMPISRCTATSATTRATATSISPGRPSASDGVASVSRAPPHF